MPPLTLQLSEKDLSLIRQITKKGRQDARVVLRANVLRFLHKGLVSTKIADLLDIDSKTVTNIGHNFIDFGLERALYDDPRTGKPISIDDRDKARIVALVCSDPPDGFARWTLELIKEKVEEKDLVSRPISKEKIRIILTEHELKPWQEKMWCLPKLDDEFIERMEDILDLYEQPDDESYPMVCLDEKPVQLIAETRERAPLAPGNVVKKDYEYKRNGSVNVFCAVEPKRGNYIYRVTERRKGPDFAKFLFFLSKKYKSAQKIRLVMDNLSTHTPKSLTDYYGERKGLEIWSRFEVHYTPKHGSWLNQAEIAIGMYSRQCLGDGRVGSFENLKQMTAAWNKQANKYRKKILWKFTTQKAREKFKYTRKN